MTDKLPVLPPRPKSFRAKTFDPYDDVFGYVETKGHMDAQDARIAELESRQTHLIDNATQNIAELEREIREVAQLLTRSKDSTSSQILYRDIVQWERNTERKNDDV